MNIETQTNSAYDRLEVGPIKIQETSTEAFEAAVDVLATDLDEEWRANRLKSDGTYEPRVKYTTDESWIKIHGTNQVDIANTEFDELPEDWQAENEAAAEEIVHILDEYGGIIDLADPSTRSEIGSRIHEAWLSRNVWAKGSELDVPFDLLPAVEQAKDLDQVATALEVFAQ